MTTEAVRFRREFWTRYAELFPEDGITPGWGRAYAWLPAASGELNVSLALYHWGAAIWLRGPRGKSPAASEARIRAHRQEFWQALSDSFGGIRPATEWVDPDGNFDAWRRFDVGDPESWPGMATWLHYMSQLYLRLIERASVPRN